MVGQLRVLCPRCQTSLKLDARQCRKCGCLLEHSTDHHRPRTPGLWAWLAAGAGVLLIAVASFYFSKPPAQAPGNLVANSAPAAPGPNPAQQASGFVQAPASSAPNGSL